MILPESWFSALSGERREPGNRTCAHQWYGMIRIPTLRTDQQPVQQVPASLLGDTRSPPILCHLLLHGVTHGERDHGRHRNGAPCVFGRRFSRLPAPGVCRAASWRAQARTHRRPAGLAKRGFPLVGRMLQHSPDSLVIPMRFDGARVHARLMQPTTHLVEGAAFLPYPGKDLADHLSPHFAASRVHLVEFFAAWT